MSIGMHRLFLNRLDTFRWGVSLERRDSGPREKTEAWFYHWCVLRYSQAYLLYDELPSRKRV
jgi:hypothetical protein